MFPQNKMKALTFSYDDGVEQDRKLLEIMNRYRIKGTFNLNSGIQTGANCFVKANEGIPGESVIRRMNIAGLPELYRGHEVAAHCLTHPHLEQLDEETIRNEVLQDRLNLERIFGKPVAGMAYPFGTFNDAVRKIVPQCGVKYARGVAKTHSCDIPADLIAYQPTVHHNDPDLFRLAEDFLASRPGKPQVFYLWGHSYEFDLRGNWNMIEEFCKMMGGRDDIYYATNAEALLP
jgi:peptidoglycan/xylan/chitin deacetylase (PgdA/CDA1 family)